MNTILIFLITCLLLPKFLIAQPAAWINEFSYDSENLVGFPNDGDEFIEIVAPVGTDMAQYGILLFKSDNTPNYTTYAYTQLSGIVSGTNADNNFGFFILTTEYSHQLNTFSPIPAGITTQLATGNGFGSIDNGPRAGILLINHSDGDVIHGVLYEITMSDTPPTSVPKDGAISSPGTGPYLFGTNVNIIYLQESSASPHNRGIAMVGEGFTENWILTNGTTSFNTPGAINSNQSALPVELSTFKVFKLGSNVKLEWTTESEINNFGFEVERCALSDECQTWEKIGFVSGNGNSNSPKNYSFIDYKTPNSTNNLFYRLKQIDNDGQFEYSEIVEVFFRNTLEFDLEQNYPNPFNPITIIRYSIQEAGIVNLKLYNLLGQEMKILVNEFKESGVYSIELDASDLTSGIYIYRIESGNFKQTRKLTVLK